MVSQQAVQQTLCCSAMLYYDSSQQPQPLRERSCIASRLRWGLFIGSAICTVVLLALVVPHTAPARPQLWFRRRGGASSRQSPKDAPPINMTEDIEEIGEHIFEVVVNNMVVTQQPPQPVLDTIVSPTLIQTKPSQGSIADIQSLTAPAVTSLPAQLKEYQAALRAIKKPLAKFTYLIDLHETNPKAMYSLLLSDLSATLPFVYTPTVGEVCEKFDTIYQNRRIPGLYIRSTDKGHVREVMDTWDKPVDMIVVTDGSRILGLGDLGANGMGIPIGKLSLYTAIGGFDPERTLPLALDTGTDNVILRERKSYQGLRTPRLGDAEYYPLVDEVITTIKQKWPQAVMQFEDFSSPHCFQLLDMYRHQARVFNDDIQGTGAVIAAGFINAAKVAGVSLAQQRIVFYGAGAAGQGVADAIKSLMVLSGMTEQEAKDTFYFVDSKGLVTVNRGDVLPPYKMAYARSDMSSITSLEDIVKAVKPTALIGLSTVPNAFNKAVVTQMAKLNNRPIIFALSNPTSKSELPANKAIRWTNGKVVYAAGSPYDPVSYGRKTYEIAQGNNLYIFPGLGLGAFLSRAPEVSEGMVIAAAQALAAAVPQERLQQGFIFPPLNNARQVSALVAAGVMEQANREGLARIPGRFPSDVLAFVEAHMWSPFV